MYRWMFLHNFTNTLYVHVVLYMCGGRLFTFLAPRFLCLFCRVQVWVQINFTVCMSPDRVWKKKTKLCGNFWGKYRKCFDTLDNPEISTVNKIDDQVQTTVKRKELRSLTHDLSFRVCKAAALLLIWQFFCVM